VVSVEITPRNASFAKACPQRVQLDVLRPCEPLPPSPFLEKLFQAGHDYEGETCAGLCAGVEGARVIEVEDPDAREWQTMQAMSAGARVVAGGRLPVDHEGHRVGEPDLLVLDADPGGPADAAGSACGYLPVDVKFHKVLDAARKPGTGRALVSCLDAPSFAAASPDPEHDARWRVDDLLQLAHYRRLLEQAGCASPLRNVGGIYGSEGVIAWYDLDEPCLDPSEYLVAPSAGRLSAMELYDLEFAHRLAVHAAALEHIGSAAAPLLAEPITCRQCDMCQWRSWCAERLEAVADLSLLPGVGVARRRLYKSNGVENLQDLAALDWTTAELLRCKVDLVDLRAQVRDLPGSTPLDTVIPKRKKQLEDLASLGFATVADLAGVDLEVLDRHAGVGSTLSTQIELARARVGPSPAYRRHEVERIGVPRGDVEVDVDMESTNDGCYLWGALVTDRRVATPAPRYVSFATWDPDLEAGELVAFKGFWSWLSDERARAESDGSSFRAYCYSRNAEQGHMTRIADRLGLRDEVDRFVTSEAWVDLLEVVKTQLITGRGMGLKETAPLASFAWRSDDIGGQSALVNYDSAADDTDPAAQVEAQRWILEYNEDDVRATAALRAWLDGPARALPSITSAPG
jgi:predicted RecB family nuclease